MITLFHTLPPKPCLASYPFYNITPMTIECPFEYQASAFYSRTSPCQSTLFTFLLITPIPHKYIKIPLFSSFTANTSFPIYLFAYVINKTMPMMMMRV